MKKCGKILTVVMAVVMAMAVGVVASACTDDAPQENKFSNYTIDQFLAENYTAKTIKYQLVADGTTATNEFGTYTFCLNLYEDGSAYAIERIFYGDLEWGYYGYWTETDGKLVVGTMQSEDSAANDVAAGQFHIDEGTVVDGAVTLTFDMRFEGNVIVTKHEKTPVVQNPKDYYDHFHGNNE